MKIYAIRGATTVDADTPEEIKLRSMELMNEILTQNGIGAEECVSLIANTTQDIRSDYPVKFIRLSGIIGDTPVFSALEPDIKGGLKLCVRYLLHIQTNNASFVPKHIYLRLAKTLKQDIIRNG